MNDLSEFSELSELAEEILNRFGISSFVANGDGGGEWKPCSGRLLYLAVCYQSNMLEVFSEHEESIILALGDRTTSVDDGPYECSAITSHSAAEIIIFNLFEDLTVKVVDALRDDLEPEQMNECPEWESLSNAQQQVVAEIEAANQPTGSGWSKLADKVRTERLLYLRSYDSRIPTHTKTGDKTGKITDADRTKIQNAIDSYRADFNGADPTSVAIQKRSELGPNKISQIMAERRAAGLWAVKARPSKKK